MTDTETLKYQNRKCDICSDELVGDQRGLRCKTCGKKHVGRSRSNELTVIFSLTALILYIPANVFPFMTMEFYGSRTTSTIWGGVVSLGQSGSVFLAAIVFLASIVNPLFKLGALFYLALTRKSQNHKRFRTHLYLFLETIGRWSMLDVFLLAILVALMKLGHWTSVTPELGSLLFAMVVILTMLASANFDPRKIWNENA